jgi:hypothetical protein
LPAFLQALAFLLEVGCALLALAATAFVLGRLLTGELGRPVERWAVPASLGLAALAHLGLLLGLAGLLRPVPVLILLAGIHLLGREVWRGLFRSWRTRGSGRGRLVALGAVALFPSALLALYAPTAFDATLYHLPFVRGFLASGGVPFLADLRFPVFPQANEMLFALAMMLAPDVAAQGVQWLMTALCAALVWAWGRDAFSRPVAGWLAAAAFLGNPIVAYLAGNAYIEAGLTLFATAALYALKRWRGSGERRWLVLSAVFAATAADTKYLGLFFVGVIGLAVLCGRLPREAVRPWRARWAGVALFTAVALLVIAPWYGRIYAWTGNPIFPFFPQVFGGSPWEPLRFQSFLVHPVGMSTPVHQQKQIFLDRLADLARLPWDVVFQRDKYNGQPPFSPLYLATLPLAALAAWRDPRQRRLLALAAAYAFPCITLPPDARYLVPALPLVSLSAAGVLLPLLDRLPGRRLLAAGLCTGCLLPGWLYPFYRFHVQGPPPLTAEQREAYLARRQPYYPAISFMNRSFGSRYTLWALHAESMSYYASGRFLGDWIGIARFDRMLRDLRSPEDLHDRVRRLGAGYLMVRSPESGLPFPEDAAFRRWFELVYQDPNARIYRLR